VQRQGQDGVGGEELSFPFDCYLPDIQSRAHTNSWLCVHSCGGQTSRLTTPIKAIGKGAYGVVCSAKLKDKEKVAIKKIGASRTERNGAGGRSQDQVHACIPQAK